MITFDQVSKVYPNQYTAVDTISFDNQKCEMVFIAGHSGAGKSTILKLIAGIIKPTSGRVSINGHNIGALSDDQLGYMRQHIGIVFQDHKILFDRSALENVMLPLQIIGYDIKAAKKRALTALEKVGLGGRENTDPVTFSGGEQQRLCFARAVVHQPSVIIADEPSANLDRAYALDIMELFKSFHKNGATVIISAHDESIMADYGHRIIRLQEGRFYTK